MNTRGREWSVRIAHLPAGRSLLADPSLAAAVAARGPLKVFSKGPAKAREEGHGVVVFSVALSDITGLAH